MIKEDDTRHSEAAGMGGGLTGQRDIGGAVPTGGNGAPALDALLDVTLPVTIEFGRTSMTVEDVLALRPGSVVQLDRLVGEPIDIYVSDRKLASGEVVVVGEHFGVRVTKIVAEPEVEADT